MGQLGVLIVRFTDLYLCMKMFNTQDQLNSELIYEVIVSPKMQTKNYIQGFLPYQTRIVTLFLVSLGSFFGYDPCLFGRAEIFVIFGLYFGKNDEFINSF